MTTSILSLFGSNVLRSVSMQRNQPCTHEVTVRQESGLHLRPLSQIFQLTQKFGCKLMIRKGDRAVDGTSMLDLLTLGAEQGSVLLLETEGERAEEALKALLELFDRDFAIDDVPD